MEAIAFVALMPVLAVVAFVGWALWKVLKGVIWLLKQVFRGIGFLLVRIASFVRGSFVQSLHTVGAALTAAAVLPLTLANLLIGRWAAAKHYGRGLEDEFGNVFSGIYRLAIVQPARLFGLDGVLDRVQRRVGVLVDQAPRPARRAERRRAGQAFPGYDVISTLPTGGSGARLYLASPKPETQTRFAAAGRQLPSRVVIKSFALDEGSTLPQIVRESRALEAASKLGLVLEHDLRPDRFYYVTRYVEGEELNAVGQQLHAQSGPDGLGHVEMGLVLGYAQDLLHTLHGFHSGGLWHKDVKPANVIVAGDRAHLVDFGLVTPLASALTLTTHGTEYYRDPEMVRLALQGVRVYEVDGVKFDLYSAGAVLYSLVENSFPAQGSLSRITKRAPEAFKWIVRRSMADIQARYGSAAEMLADVRALAQAPDPFAVRPVDLPSFRGEVPAEPAPFDPDSGFVFDPGFASGPSPARPETFVAEPSEEIPKPRRRRRRRVAMAAAAIVATSFVGSQLLHEARTRKHAFAYHPMAINHLTTHDRATLAQAQETLRAVRGLQNDGLDWFQGSVLEQEAAETPEPVQVLPWTGERVLLMEDFQGEDEKVVSVFKELLQERGVEVVGVGDSPEDVSLTAGARHAAGLSGPEDPDVYERLGNFLEHHADLAGLIWAAPSLEDDTPLVLMVPRDQRASGGLYRLDGLVAKAQ